MSDGLTYLYLASRALAVKIQGDRMKPEEFSRFLQASFAAYRAVIKPGASVYVCHASSVQRIPC